MWLILLRFIFCNLANSQWQEMGKSMKMLLVNTCGCSRANPEAAGKYYVLALIFSVWSLVHLGDGVAPPLLSNSIAPSQNSYSFVKTSCLLLHE